MDDTRTYNHDLLLGTADQFRAKQMFPEVAWILDFTRLQDRFRPIDASSNRRKRIARRTGVLAILLAAAALGASAVEPLFSKLVGFEQSEREVLQAALAVCGVLAVILSTSALLHGAAKERWLADRMRTERLRQFHFQFIVRRAAAIVAATTAEARAKLLRERDLLFDGELDALLLRGETGGVDAAIDDEGADHCWLVPEADEPEAGGRPPDPDHDLFKAYYTLRIQEQAGYASSRARMGRSLSNAGRQQKLIRDVTYTGVIVIFCLDFATPVLAFAGESAMVGPAFQAVGMAAAVAALAAQAFEEGLRPSRERERYRHYAYACRSARTKFKAAQDAAGKLAAMAAVEEAAYDEMCGFLAAHRDSSFTM